MNEVIRCGLIALCGLPNAGKSSLLNRVVGANLAPVSHRPETTRRQVRGVYTKDLAQFIFVDTPGVSDESAGLRQRMAKEIRMAVMGVDVLVWMADAALSSRKNDMQLEAFEKWRKFAPPNAPLFLLLNKIDLLKDRKELLAQIALWQLRAQFVAIMPVSVKNGEGIEHILSELSKVLPEREHLFDQDAITDASEREIVGELVRESATRLLNEELPYQLAVTVESFDEARRSDAAKPLIHIDAVIHVEKDSQKAIVLGKQGSKIKEIGAKARQSIERLLGCQVMLKLFVRVEEKWTKTPKSLRKLGY